MRLPPHLSGIGTFPFGRLPGFQRASPSTPLDVSSYVRSKIARLRAELQLAAARRYTAQQRSILMPADEPRSLDAEPSQAYAASTSAPTRQ